jgi:ElaB/YqjD/DUF883 family membrane-anchored ribosome-binding protein
MAFFQLAAAAETLVVRQMSPERSGFDQVASVASGLNSILVLLLLLLVVAALLGMRAKVNALHAKAEELIDELRPMAQKATLMADDVRDMARNINHMVHESRDTVRDANTRVRKSVTALTERVDDVTELIGEVHRAAVRVSAIAGTAVGGIRLGARALGFGRRKKKKAKGGTGRPRLRRRA